VIGAGWYNKAYMDKLLDTVKANKIKYVTALVLFLGFSAWFFYIHTFDLDTTEKARQLWGALYQVVALFGAVVGLFLSRNWGGYKSLLGRTILFLSLSLLFQSFGQSVSSYYNYFAHIDIPYPSLGDLGFFGSTIFYILGVSSLAKASGFRFSFKSAKGKLIAVLIPLIMLFVSFWFFLKGYEFDWTNPLRVILDLGYPLGDALYVSIAILTFILSRDFLGGIMRKPILFLVFALVAQYVADFTFLYQASRGTWVVGTADDYLYFTSYFLMTVGLIYIGSSIFNKIKES
jgi:hypothetical protein